MVYPVTGWFEVIQYRNKKEMMVATLVENMWMVWYTWPVVITYDQGGKLLGN